MSELRRERIEWGTAKVDLEGPELKVGDKAPASFTLSANDLSDVTAASISGKVRILCSVPSLDTKTCDIEMQRFNQEASSLPGVTVYAISLDLPFAQKRWCGATGSDKLVSLSDYKHRNFGTAYGVFTPAKGLLARAVFVVGKDDVIKHVQYVSPTGSEPDYAAALTAAKALL
jgi:thiol peroxidase